MTDLSPLNAPARASAQTTGTLYGVGLGPGDPELLTIKAVRLIHTAPTIAFFAKAGRRGNARTIVDPWIRPGTRELPLAYPVTTEIPLDDPAYAAALGGFYAEAAGAIAARLDAGEDVVLLAEGDPLFYGSFMHMFARLDGAYRVEIVPGVTGMSGCWSAARLPITWGDDIMTVLPGTLDEATLTERLKATDAAVIMKLGQNLPKVRRALEAAGLLERAILVERGTMAGETVTRLSEHAGNPVPYFSILLVAGEGRRP